MTDYLKKEDAADRAFFRIVSWSTALGLGCAAALTASLRSACTGFSLQFSVGTVAAFLGGAAFALLYWKLVFTSRRAARAASVMLLLLALGAFLYPLRYVPVEKLPSVAIGLAAAACVVSAGGIAIYRLARFFNAENAGMEAAQTAIPSRADKPAHSSSGSSPGAGM